MSTTSTATVGHITNDFKPSGSFRSVPYFNCNSTTFDQCVKGKLKGAHWNTFMGKSDFTTNIKKWLKSNKNSSLLEI